MCPVHPSRSLVLGMHCPECSIKLLPWPCTAPVSAASSTEDVPGDNAAKRLAQSSMQPCPMRIARGRGWHTVSPGCRMQSQSAMHTIHCAKPCGDGAPSHCKSFIITLPEHRFPGWWHYLMLCLQPCLPSLAHTPVLPSPSLYRGRQNLPPALGWAPGHPRANLFAATGFA